jgi:hypothetical protein
VRHRVACINFDIQDAIPQGAPASALHEGWPMVVLILRTLACCSLWPIYALCLARLERYPMQRSRTEKCVCSNPYRRGLIQVQEWADAVALIGFNQIL